MINTTTIISKKNIAFFLFVFINFLFCLKYSSRITEFYILLSVILCLGFYLLYSIRFSFQKLKNIKLISLSLLFLFLATSCIGFYLVPVDSLQVDRWSVITSFWDTFFSGKYAYFAQSNVGNPPGPMPFYFILALPFYLIGELGLFSLCGIVIFYLLMGYANVPKFLKLVALLFIMISPFYLWEVISRSNIFLNSSLVLLALLYFFKNKNFGFCKTLIIGLIVGLLMSTRNVFAIPFLIAFLFALRKNIISFKKLIILGAVALLIFGVTFLPFVMGHFEEFKIMNPFLVQSTFLIPFQYTIGFIFLALIFGFVCKKSADVYFYCGLILFISILIYFLYHCFIIGFSEAYFGNVIDISYFIFSAPFFLFYVLNNTKSPDLLDINLISKTTNS